MRSLYTVIRIDQWVQHHVVDVFAASRKEALREAKKTLGKQRVLDIKWSIRKQKDS